MDSTTTITGFLKVTKVTADPGGASLDGNAVTAAYGLFNGANSTTTFSGFINASTVTLTGNALVKNIYTVGGAYLDGNALGAVYGTFSGTGASGTSISSATITSAVIPTITGNSNFSGTASTVTFSGWVDIGWGYITGSDAGNEIYCTCPAGKKIIAAGCTGNATVGANSRIPQLLSNGFTADCYWVSSTVTGCWAYCARVK